MVSFNEELEAAKAARAAVNAILTTERRQGLATLKNASRVAILNLGSGDAVNEARGRVGIALSSIMYGLPTAEKINKAKSAIDAWIKELARRL